ncbi:NAD(P)/FAD-dependent oxidoreductase [Massilia sp. W12]|uniref:NAD(P)/FAD-dependent oxidoreductase n=1 Tax=Massilia sp. W12 TaxID=3126507 RepID=UPI0030CAC894
MKRRQLLQALGGAALLSGCAGFGLGAPAPRVVVVGGGYAGATAARYLKHWGGAGVHVSLIEPNPQFISCPLSNRVLGGEMQLDELRRDYRNLQALGVELIAARVAGFDPAKRQVQLEDGRQLPYQRLIVAPGIDLLYDSIQGLSDGLQHAHILHAWKAGPQTLQLRAQLQAMRDGGVYVLTVPLAPYRCPPGPYERACQVAHYFKQHKPKSKVLILDANPDVTSKAGLFKKVWATQYAGMVEYQPKFNLTEVDATQLQVQSEFGDKHKADVLNVVPPQAAGSLLRKAGLANMNGRWCEVDFLTYESKVAAGVHVLGDAIQIAPLMPKSAHMANQHAKVCAAAVLDLLAERAPNPQPLLTNTCYSFVDAQNVIHVASVHQYDAAKKTMLTVPGSGGLSTEPNLLEGQYAMNWANNIWADSLG